MSDHPSCWWLFSYSMGSTWGPFSSTSSPCIKWLWTLSLSLEDFGWARFLTVSLLMLRTFDSLNMDSNVHTMTNNTRIYVLEKSSSSSYHFGGAWYRVAVGSMDILALCATVLSTAYNTEHFQGLLLTPHWQLLGRSWLVTRHQRHLQHLFDSFSAAWSSMRHVSWRCVMAYRLWATIFLTSIGLVPGAPVHCLLLPRSCCWLKFRQRRGKIQQILPVQSCSYSTMLSIFA